MERTTVKLAKLVAGPNQRSDITRVSIEDLVASIPIHGVLNPLIVRKSDKGKFVVHAGGRRLRALNRLYKQDRNYEVPVIIMDDAIDNLDEIALIDNTQRINLHPVDEYHQYSALVDKGLSQPEIAARFGVTLKWVGQRLQLAKLSPEILKDWRAGKVDADQAAALSANADHATQNMVWSRAKDEWAKRPDRLRQSVQASATLQSSPRFKFVGSAAYEMAGGEYSDDLFTEQRIILNPVLLLKLEEEKLTAECKRLTSDGWKWARTENDLGGRVWNWPTIDISPWARPEEKITLAEGDWNEKLIVKSAVLGRMLGMPSSWTKGGVIVAYDAEGDFNHRYFMADELRSDEYEEAAPDEPLDEPEPKPQIRGVYPPIPEAEPKVNFALREDMAEILTLAVAEALSHDHKVAAAALLATLVQQITGGFGSRSPLALKVEPWGPHAPDGSADTIAWEKVFEEELNGSGHNLAHLISCILDMRWQRFDPKQWTDIGRKRMTRALCDALPAEALQTAIEERFDREAYFARLSIAQIVAILASDLGHSGGATGPKAAIVSLAARLAAEKGWLPLELRIALFSPEAEL
jgi:ParB/RepB/Spo0J family partition protein